MDYESPRLFFSLPLLPRLTLHQCDVGQFSGTAEEVDKKAKSQGLPPAKDDDGNPWLPGKCKCEDKGLEAFADELIDVVARALSKLDNVICAVLVSAFKEIAEIGLEFVPGGSSVKVAKAIKYAKSAYQNGSKYNCSRGFMFPFSI